MSNKSQIHDAHVDGRRPLIGFYTRACRDASLRIFRFRSV